MSTGYPSVFSPVRVGKLELKNRILLAPMEGTTMIEWMMPTGFRKEVHDFYIERAKDGVGLMVPGMTPVRSLLGGTEWLHEHPEAFEGLSELLKEIHSYGSRVFIQLGLFSGRNFILSRGMADLLDQAGAGQGEDGQGEAGRRDTAQAETEAMAQLVRDIKVNMKAPDEGSPNVWLPEYTCRALTVEEIHEYVQAYAKSALLCKINGADGVEVHAVHEGYLMDQFTTPYTNHRQDEYGGSFENRYRFAVEVVRAIKELCGEDFPVSMRYSVTSKTRGYNAAAVPGETFTEAGRTMEESERAIKYLEEAGVDLFNCDNGTYDAWFWAHPPVYMPLNCNLEEVKHIKQFTSRPVYCAGRMQMDTAEREIAAGTIDGVTIGRQILVDEEYLTKMRSGREAEVHPCIGCHNACLALATFKGVGAETLEATDHRYCALNPRAFEEKRYTPVPSAHPRKMAVIGGGIGGVEFAIQAARRGHNVTLYEKTGRIGGVFNEAAAMDFKEKDKELLAWYERELAKSPVKVCLNTEITDLDAVEADEIIVATGAQPRRLNIPGAERAIDAASFLKDRSVAGEHVVIVGGGLTGCEIAYQLALDGKKPAIVEMTDDLIKAVGVSAANTTMLRELMRFHQVPVYLESTTEAISGESVRIRTPEGEKELPADTVIVSIGYISSVPFETEGRAHVHLLGDAGKVGNLKTAIWGANDLVLSLS